MPTDCLSVLNTTRSLLSVPRSELIANLRDSHRSDADFGEIISVDIDGTGSVSFGESHLVNLTVFPSSSSSFSGRVMVFPMITSSPETLKPRAIMPSSSSLSR